METVLIIAALAFIALAVYGGVLKNRNARRIAEEIQSAGVDLSGALFSAAYLGGHPDIDLRVDRVVILLNDSLIEVWKIPEGFDAFSPERMGGIPIASISGAHVEDQTTVEKRITVARLLAVGVFALAWQKRRKIESAYLIIEWSGGRFQHETVFEFTGTGAMQAANAARNAVLRAAG